MLIAPQLVRISSKILYYLLYYLQSNELTSTTTTQALNASIQTQLKRSNYEAKGSRRRFDFVICTKSDYNDESRVDRTGL
jgi:hypothetical protein